MNMTIKQYAELPTCSVLLTNAFLVSFHMCHCTGMIFNCQFFLLCLIVECSQSQKSSAASKKHTKSTETLKQS